MANKKQLIIVTHPVHTDITEDEVRGAVHGEYLVLGVEAIQPARLTFVSTQGLDWDALASAQLREWTTKVVPLLERYPEAEVAYFGLAPIPLAFHLGSLTERLRGLQVFQRHHTTRRWTYTNEAAPVLAPPSGAGDLVRSTDPVIVAVSTTTQVDLDSARAHIGATSAEVQIATGPLGEDVLSSAESVSAVAKAFREALERVELNRPGAEEIHLFAAIPVGLAFLLGSQTTATRHARVVTYQYFRSGEPRFHRAIRVPFRASANAVITEQQRRDASATREDWESERQRIAELLAKSSGPWHAILGELASPFEAGSFSELQAARDTPLSAPIACNEPLLDEEFRYDHATRRWLLTDGLLAAIGTKVTASDLPRAGRMLLLHEALHHGLQGVSATSATMIRLAPKVLEELDYTADTWAMMHEFYISDLVVGEWATQRTGLLEIIDAAVATMWAFDAGRELGQLEVRRVCRYLIWYTQLARLGEAVDALDAMAIMARKPVIELVGPPVHIRDGRYVLSLNESSNYQHELCFLDRKGKLCRVGTTNAVSVRDLARALGNHQGSEVRGLVRAFVTQHS